MRNLILLALVAGALAVCDERRVDVSTAAQLTSALFDAREGDTIVVAPGTYSGTFEAKAIGRQDCPIILRGSAIGNVIIDGGSITPDAAGIRITGSYWAVQGFVVQNVRHGLVMDNAHYCTADYILATNTGDEGISMIHKSTFNQVTRAIVRQTGMLNPANGYGVMLGADKSDPCTDNAVHGLALGDNVPMQRILVRSMCDRTTLYENTYSAYGMRDGQCNVEMQANDCDCYFSSYGNPTSNPRIVDGIRVYGNRNVLYSNSIDLRSTGYGINVVSGTGNVVCRTNTVSNAGSGLTNVAPDPAC